ncbi:MAG: T9SS type A sorting domain-containing protein [Bacteroidetes bacterium]|nr:T9SS type A sorting domain-containing protein [Bacteroidota bacterium]
MKTMLTAATVIAMAAIFWLPARTFAAGNDTLVVYANGPSLDQIINTDTTGTGAQAHSVYELVSLDTTYLFTGAITPRSQQFTIIGVLGSNGRPPCIQPGLLQSGSLAGTFCTISKAGSNVLIKNIYFFGRGPNDAWVGNPLITVPSDSTRLHLDSLVVDEVHGTTVTYTGVHDIFYFTNSKYRNDVWPNNFTSPGLVNPAYPTSNPCDTCVVDGNTFFCHEGSVAGIGPLSKYLEVDHNSFVYNFEYPVGNYYFQYLTNEKIENNIFYGTYAAGVTIPRYHSTHVTPVQPVGIVEMDTLTLAEAKQFDPADSSNPNVRMLAEAKRIAVIRDNVFFEPAAIDSFWTAWDDTAHGTDSLITPSLMSAETDTMFAHPSLWPGYQSSGNLIGVDPGFGSSFQSVLQSSSTPGVVSLQQFITEVWTAKIKTDEWGYQKQTVSGSNWIPQWPLPETADMQYKNATVKSNSTDGLPCGDPSWFGMTVTAVNQMPASVATTFNLGNNYPNPFNPSTVINVSLARSGMMSLKIYNVLGELVKVVDQGYKAPGAYTYDVNMNNFASGVYFYTLRQGSSFMAKKMILLK